MNYCHRRYSQFGNVAERDFLAHSTLKPPKQININPVIVRKSQADSPETVDGPYQLRQPSNIAATGAS